MMSNEDMRTIMSDEVPVEDEIRDSSEIHGGNHQAASLSQGSLSSDEHERVGPTNTSLESTQRDRQERIQHLLEHIKTELTIKQEEQQQQELNTRGSASSTSTDSKEQRVSIDLSAQDVMLLADLLEKGQIDRNSKLGSAVGSAMREMTMVTYANVIQRVRGDGHWPVNVAFHDLTYMVSVPKEDPGILNVATAFAAPFMGKGKNAMELPIIDKISGVFKAGTSTVVLGPPGCGVTTLFKTLSGRIKTGRGRKILGELYYSGFAPEDLHVRKLSTYVDQNDNHIPVLTVRETLQFAYNCFGGPEEAKKMIEKVGIAPEASDHDIARIHEEYDNFPDFVIRNLALSNAADTIVGNELMRGVSGGEKKRVTSAEMMMARRPLAFYDQITTGLDSSATYDICRRITGVAHRLDLTAVCALLQPPPETYELFDEVMVLAMGKVMFHGKRESVLPYFESLGYACPDTMDVADFIQEVCTVDRKKYRTRDNAPADEAEMAQAWLESPYSKPKKDEVDRFCTPENKIDSQMRQDLYDKFQPLYATSICRESALVVARQLKLSFRDVEFVKTRTIQALVVGVFIGSLFYKIDPDMPTNENGDQNPVLQRYGILFATMIHSALAGASQIPVVLTQRPVFYKQSDAFFFRTGNYVLGEFCSVLPLAFIESTLLALMAFWISWLVPFGEHSPTGQDDVGGAFMLYWLLMVLLNISYGSWLRALASLSPSPAVGQVLSGLSTASISLFSGYLLTADTVPDWFIWIYWLSPLAWAFRAGVIVIFTSSCYTDAQQEYALQLFGFENDINFVWSAYLMLVGYTFVGLYVSYLSYVYMRFEGGGGRAVDIEEDAEEINDGDIVQREQAAFGLNGKNPAEIKSDPQPAEDHMTVNMETPRSSASESGKITFTPVDLAFRNLWYSVQGPKDGAGKYNLSLLKGITGYAEAGTLTALMGSSGAGKTTLMDVLALRKTGGKIEGEVLVNGRPQEKTTFSRIIGYVEQMDIHSPNATVHEALTFSAYLRQPSDIPRAEKDKFVESVLKTLHMRPIRNFKIGFKGMGGLSTEQAKRLTIGVELAANPAIIFADEPTSGLDASSARVVMNGLERIARGGRTVVCTIHQPSKAIFEKFDRLLLLRRGGQMVYFGDLGENSKHLLDYLDGLPGTPGMPNPRYNPATYMLEAIGANAGPGVDYAAEYEQSNIYKANEEAFDTLVKRDLEERPEIHFDTTFASTFATQTEQLVKRWFRSYWRDTAYNTTRIIVAIIVAVYFGFAFLLRGKDISSATDIQSFVGLLFLAPVFMGVMAMNSAMPTVFIERASFYRERSASYYGVMPIVIASTVAEIPYVVASSLVFVSIFYFMAGLWHNATAFWLFFAFYSIFNMCIIFWGHLLAQALPNDQVANLVGSVFIAAWCFASGLMISIDDVPYFWQWFTYINPLRYALNGLVVSQMACDDPSTQPADNPGCSYVSDGTTAWAYIQDRFGYESTDWPWCLGATIAFAAGFRIVNAFCYAFISYLRR